jgi:hypothetical protein
MCKCIACILTHAYTCQSTIIRSPKAAKAPAVTASELVTAAGTDSITAGTDTDTTTTSIDGTVGSVHELTFKDSNLTSATNDPPLYWRIFCDGGAGAVPELPNFPSESEDKSEADVLLTSERAGQQLVSFAARYTQMHTQVAILYIVWCA